MGLSTRACVNHVHTIHVEHVAPIKLKKVREKRAAPWYSSYTHSLNKETRNLEHKRR